ncbi:MAG: hypothetical protein IT488_08935 [Gammaproteobacteria bacterium]|nr:hypothetical protein [Gammaproteobacteria bacterium]
MIQRIHLLFAGLLLPCACLVMPATAQDISDVAEDRDIAAIEQCLQRAAEQKIDEDRVDDFIDRCIDELYAQKEQAAGTEDTLDAEEAPRDSGAGKLPSD